MKKLVFIAMVNLLLIQVTVAQKQYMTTKGHASFFSKAPIADVDAHNSNVKAELNTSTDELNIYIKMIDFKFASRKMGNDARKKYIEIDKFPQAGFKGKISGKIDYDKPGTYPATAAGKLKIHGVEKEVTEKGTVIVQNGQVRIQSEFYTLLKDYHIETPKIMGKEMTEDRVLVKIDITLAEQAKDVASKKQK